MMDFAVVLKQAMLARVSDESLSEGLADHAVALAFRLGKTPQEILKIASENVGFSEEEWRNEVEPQIREFIEKAKVH